MKNSVFYFILIIVGLFIAASCEVEEQPKEIAAADYFPLHTGNYWELSFIGTRSIDSVVTLNGKDYYRMLRYWKSGAIRDTVYYRKTTDGKVFERTRTTDEILKFDLKISSGGTWNFDVKYPNRNYTYNATLRSTDDTVHLGGTTTNKIYKYYYDIPQTADEEHFIWLAPDIGFVKEVYLGGTSDRIVLKRVRINGVEKEF